MFMLVFMLLGSVARALNWENAYSPQLVSSQPDALVVQFEDFEILC